MKKYIANKQLMNTMLLHKYNLHYQTYNRFVRCKPYSKHLPKIVISSLLFRDESPLLGSLVDISTRIGKM